MATTLLEPRLLKGKEFEEYISAIFQANGCYTERNIIDRGEREVLELDIITTNYKSGSFPPEIKLLEVKSGDWGFQDLFKVRGWMTYSGITKGFFITQKEKEKMEQ